MPGTGPAVSCRPAQPARRRPHVRRPCDGTCCHQDTATPAPPVPTSRCPVSRPPAAPRCPAPQGPPAVDPEAAAAFLTQFHAETASDGLAAAAGCARCAARSPRTGTYRHTPEELTFGARVAWRNSARCIGRLYWNSLRVRDRRDVDTPAEVAAECVEHLRDATRGRPHPVHDHDLRPGPARPARPAHPQRAADPLRRAPDAVGRRARRPPLRRVHRPCRRAGLGAPGPARPVRRAAAAHLGRRRGPGARSTSRRTRCSRCR